MRANLARPRGVRLEPMTYLRVRGSKTAIPRPWSIGANSRGAPDIPMSKPPGREPLPASHWLAMLKTTTTADRRWKKAVAALAAMGLRVVPALVEATGDNHPEVRGGASQALFRIGPATVPFSIKALKHENAWIRERAARRLYGFARHAQKAIPPLVEALNDPSAFVRQWVIAALGAMGRQFGPLLTVAVPGLTARLTDEDFMVREWAACALGDLGALARSALPALERASADPMDSVREAAAGAYQDISTKT